MFAIIFPARRLIKAIIVNEKKFTQFHVKVINGNKNDYKLSKKSKSSSRWYQDCSNQSTTIKPFSTYAKNIQMEMSRKLMKRKTF